MTGHCQSAAARRLPALAASLVFLLLALSVLSVWSNSGRYLPTGDEPHYLVMANGIVTQHSLEQTAPYQAEFRERRFYPGLAPPGSAVGPLTAQVVLGPHGAFSIHNIGLPTLLAGPVALGGIAGARLALVAVASLLGWLAVLATGAATGRWWRPLVVSVALTCSLPFLTAAGQIYPDVTAGAVYLAGCVGLMQARRRPGLLWVPYAAAALLPWLQVKFGVLAVLLVAAALHRSWRSSPGRRYPPVVLPVASAVALLSYNRYAYGNVAGPYGDGALQPGLRALQTAAGLLLDQNQGLLFQNPLLLIAGVAGLAPLWARDRIVAMATAAGALLMLSLNALHPNWYGGLSFSGRFMWTSAAILVLPAALLLGDLWRRRPTATRLVLGVSLLGQALIVDHAVRGGAGAATLYSRFQDTPLVGYSMLFRPVERWLPALTNPDWAWRYLPNLLWPASCLALLVLARLVRGRRLARPAMLLASAAAAGVVVAVPLTVAAPIEARTLLHQMTSLKSLTGYAAADGARSALPGRDAKGFLVYGPGAGLPRGEYTARFTVSSPASRDVSVGMVDVDLLPPAGPRQAAAITGTSGTSRVVEVRFRDDGRQTFQTRLYWDGVQPITVTGIQLTAD